MNNGVQSPLIIRSTIHQSSGEPKPVPCTHASIVNPSTVGYLGGEQGRTPFKVTHLIS